MKTDWRKMIRTRGLGLALMGAACFSAGAALAQATPLKPSRPEMTRPAAWDAAEEIKLWPGDAPGQEGYRPLADFPNWPGSFLKSTPTPTMRIWRPVHPNGRALLVIPGGGYMFVSIANEGVQVAERFAAKGYLVAVLNYRLPGEGWSHRADVPLQDAQRAIRLLRQRAETLAIQPDHVAVAGFSAGGHLAGSLATGWQEAVYAPVDAADALTARPDAVGLIYPVLSLEQPLAHAGSRSLLLGDDASPDLIQQRSPTLHVSAETPPSFLVHAWDDTAVSPDNSLAWIAAARAAHRPVEAHLYQEGGHGFGLGVPGSPSTSWADLFAAWLDRVLE